MEFTNRESKFEKEQKVRREALKKAKEVEKRKEAAQAAREKELEERRIAKREEEERKLAGVRRFRHLNTLEGLGGGPPFA